MMKAIEEFDKKTRFEIEEYDENSNFEVPEVWTAEFYKTYPRFEQIKLKQSLQKGEIEDILLSRESTREFSQNPISFEDLSHILKFSAGAKPNNPKRRMYPSGGARYPIEIYLFAYSVEGLSPGIYHFNIKENTLEQLRKEKPPFKGFFAQNIKNASAIIVMTGVLSRSEIKYLESSYKFALIECGHIAQNISLLSKKQNVESCCLAGFDSEKIIKHLDLVKEEEIPLYAIALGKLLPKGVNNQYKLNKL